MFGQTGKCKKDVESRKMQLGVLQGNRIVSIEFGKHADFFVCF